MSIRTAASMVPGNQIVRMSSYIADYLRESGQSGQFVEEEPIEIAVLSPARTLFEKLSALHGVALSWEAGDKTRLVDMGRHYYDIHELLDSSDVRGSAESTTDTHGRTLACSHG